LSSPHGTSGKRKTRTTSLAVPTRRPDPRALSAYSTSKALQKPRAQN
jgi:hypothetical protein